MTAVRPRSRWRRVAAAVFVAVLVWHFGAVLLGFAISWPTDYLITLGSAPFRAELQAPADGKRRVVVLQHGLWRTEASLNRLERTLREHGYEVWNPGYPSVRATIEEHAARLRDTVEAIHERPVDELSFVGHSMGGLVIEEYLRRPDSRPVQWCVYLAVPHRGAVLADLRKHWFVFQLVMGTKAAMQLSPGDPLHSREIPFRERSGVLIGDKGEGCAAIAGVDDGTIAPGEADLPGARDSLVVPFGHTRITLADDVAHQVLHFLRHGAFAKTAAAR